MLSHVFAQLFALWSVFGLSSPHVSPTQPQPPAIVRPAHATSTVKTSRASTTPKSVTKVHTPPSNTTQSSRREAAPSVTTPPEPSSSTTIDFATEVAVHTIELMNTERIAAGLPALTSNLTLADLARAHSADMLAQGYFSHNDPNGCSSSCRATAAGYAWQAIGENIYFSSGYSLSAIDEAAMVVKGWMQSSGHRANILGSQYTQTGVGVAIQGENVYVTAVYSKPR